MCRMSWKEIREHWGYEFIGRCSPKWQVLMICTRKEAASQRTSMLMCEPANSYSPHAWALPGSWEDCPPKHLHGHWKSSSLGRLLRDSSLQYKGQNSTCFSWTYFSPRHMRLPPIMVPLFPWWRKTSTTNLRPPFTKKIPHFQLPLCGLNSGLSFNLLFLFMFSSVNFFLWVGICNF